MSVWEDFRHRAQTEGAEAALRELLAKAATLAPEDGLRVDFAAALKDAGRPEEALGVLAPAVAEGDFHVRFRALIERGICLLLLGRDEEAVLKALRTNTAYLQREVAHRVQNKYAAKLKFLADESFDEGSHIDALLRRPEVARDLDGE